MADSDRTQGARNLEELKAEAQRRADRNLAPLSGVDPEDARAALQSIDSLDRDQWAAAWIDVGRRYLAEARARESSLPGEALALYLRAWHNFNAGRWPTEKSPKKREAYAAVLDAFASHARLVEPPIEIVRIPFEGGEIVGYLRLPNARPAPVVLGIAGLDSRKEDVAALSGAYVARGIAVLALDMPGTGQAPIKADVGAERMFSAVLDYIGTRAELDAARVVVQGRSWSGYWAAVLACTERDRLRGAVMHGGPVHAYFQREWQEQNLETREYLFDLFEARAAIYPGVETREQLFAFGPRLSLVARGLIDRPSAPMLLVNGARDTQVPIDDLFLLMRHGTPKEAWVNPVGGHMGRSADFTSPMIAREVVIPWVVRALTGEVGPIPDR
jgi:pimeloyl-ACP methyl ester carboxylesterase